MSFGRYVHDMCVRGTIRDPNFQTPHSRGSINRKAGMNTIDQNFILSHARRASRVESSRKKQYIIRKKERGAGYAGCVGRTQKGRDPLLV